MTKKLLLAVAALLLAAPVLAAEYMVAVSRPNNLYLIDLAKRRVERTVVMPGDGIPGSIAIPRDGKVAYVLTNRFESVVGIDLDSGKQVFRADFSTPALRVKGFFGIAVSEDGRELYVHQSPVALGRAEYEVQDTRIAVFDTADGIQAKARRSFPAPRRISFLATNANKDRLIALGWDFYLFNARSGKIEKTLPMRHWQRPNVGEPDMLAMWGHYEQARAFATPYYVAMTDADPASPEAFKAGIAVLDLDSEVLKFAEFENAVTAIFSSVVNPVAKNEVFSVMNQLTKVDMDTGKLVKRADAEQTFYAINISSDGKELYVGGALDKIGIYDSTTLAKTGEIVLPTGADMAIGWMKIVQR